MIDKEYVRDKIKSVIDRKLENKTPPYHAMDFDLSAEIMKDVYLLLNELYKERAIEVGKTINGKYIKLKETT